MAYAGGSAAAAAAAAVAHAIKASGGIVRMAPEQFIKILGKADKPLVVHATGGFFSKNYQYLTSYKGIYFYTKSSNPLMLPGSAEVIVAEKIWVPQG